MSRRPVRWHETVLFIAIAALALLWPAMVNGGPFWFPDTTAYIRGADAATVVVTGKESEWSDRLVRIDPAAAAKPSTTELTRSQAERERLVPTRPVIAGRSVYFGLLLYLPMRLFGPWGAIGLQALLVAGLLTSCLGIVARSLRIDPRILLPASVAILAALTPLPFYTSMLMPGVYSGLIIATLATTICFWDGLSRPERILLISASAIIATFHTTHVLIALGLGAAAAVLLFRGWARLRPVLIVAPSLLLAALAAAAFSLAVKSYLGEGPLSPPFLSARITAAGPGTQYLQQHCNGSDEDFALCAHRARLPLSSDNFLWTEDNTSGLFQLVDGREQRRIASEDKAFFLAVFADDPIAVISASVWASVLQLGAFDLENFNYSDRLKAAAPGILPTAVEAQFIESRAYHGQMPVSVTVAATVASTLASIGIIAFLLLRSLRLREFPLPPAQRYVFLVLLGVLANALICGALSKPGARYQMRLIWLLPAAALVGGFANRQSRGPQGEGEVVDSATITDQAQGTPA